MECLGLTVRSKVRLRLGQGKARLMLVRVRAAATRQDEIRQETQETASQ